MRWRRKGKGVNRRRKGKGGDEEGKKGEEEVKEKNINTSSCSRVVGVSKNIRNKERNIR